MEDSILDNIIERYKERNTNHNLEISDEEILTLIEAARLAPSADNSQIWRFLILKDPLRQKAALTGLVDREKKYNRLIIALAAPFFIRHIRREHPFYMIDVPISITHILLMGVELNIHIDVLFDLNRDKLSHDLEIPEEYKVVALLGLSRYVDREE